MLGRLRARCDAVGKALLRRAPLVSRGDVTGEEGIAGANGRNRLELLDLNLVPGPVGSLTGATPERCAVPPLTDDRDTSVRPRDDRLAGPHLDQALEPGGEVHGAVELVADGALRLEDVGGDHCGL